MNGTDWSQQDDNTLMQGIADRNEAALRCLIRRFAPMVIATCNRILGSRVDAEDVAAELFAELWYRGDRFDRSRGTPRAYMRLLARSRCFDRLRKHGSARTPDDGPLLELLVDSNNSPFESAELSDLSKMVRASLAELTAEQQEAIELAFFDGLTHEETARRMGMPLGTVKTHIRKGLARLRFLITKGSQK